MKTCICITNKVYTAGKSSGGACGRSTTMGVIGHAANTTLDNKFVYGSGVGAKNMFTRLAQKRAMLKTYCQVT